MSEISNLDVEGALNIIIGTAIVKSRRDRFYQFAKSIKGRERWIKSLDHFENYIKIDSAIFLNNASHVHSCLMSGEGARSIVFAFSTQRQYKHGKFSPVEIVVEDLLDSGNGSFILAGRRQFGCYYFGEDLRSKYAWSVR